MSTIKLKHSITPSAIPSIGDLSPGEVALNIADGTIHFLNADSSAVFSFDISQSYLLASDLNKANVDALGVDAATLGGLDASAFALAGSLSLPAGGTAGQVLSKIDGTDYNVEWTTVSGGGGATTWGSITGALSAQTDLQTALDGKASISHSHVIADITDFTDNSSNWDIAFSWGDHAGLYVPIAQAIPPGGTEGQVLKKDSNSDYDFSWQDDLTGGGDNGGGDNGGGDNGGGDNGGGTSSSSLGATYKDSVYADEPVFAYLFGTDPSSKTNTARRTAGASTNGTASADVYSAPSLYEQTLTTNEESLFFDCDQTTGRPYVEIPHTTDFDVGSFFSFEALIKPVGIPDNTTGSCVIYSSSTVEQPMLGSSYYVAVDTDRVRLISYVSGVVNVVSSDIVANAIPNGVRSHIVCTVDNSSGSGEVLFYVNGSQLGEATTLNGSTVSTTKAATNGYIGGFRASTGSEGIDGRYFSGQIQAVAQYDKILTAADVSQRYSAIEKARNTLSPTTASHKYRDYIVNDLNAAMLIGFSSEENGSSTSGFADYTSNNNDGTRFGKIQLGTTPLADTQRGALFISEDGNIAYVEIPYSATTRHTGRSSVCALIAPTRNTNDDDWINNKIISIGDMGVGNEQQYGLQVTSSGYLAIRYYVDSATANTIQSTDPIPDFTTDGSVVYHVAVTVDQTSDELKFYLDGAQLGTTIAFTDTIRSRTLGSSYIGVYGTNVFGVEGFYGFIDDVSFHQEVLTAEQIAAANSLRGALDVSNLDDYVARWSFDDVGAVDEFNDDIDVWWEFNSNINESIDTKTVNTAGGGSGYVAGVENSAIDMDGINDFIYISAGNLNFPEFSIKIRFRLDVIDRTHVLIANTQIDANYGFRFFVNANNAIRLFVGDGTTNNVVFSADGIVTSGVWYEAIASFSSIGMSILLDGVELDSLTENEMTISSVDYTGCQESIGAIYLSGSPSSTSSYTHFLDGQIDDIKIIPRFVGGASVPNNAAITNFPPTNLQKGSQLNGEAVNSPARVEGYDGLADGALSFNGTDQYVSLPDVSLLKPTTSFTVTAWVETTSTSAQWIMQSSEGNVSTTNGFQVYLGSDGTLRALGGNNTGQTEGTNRFSIRPFNPINDGQWHHIAITYDGATAYGYVDALAIDSSSYANGIVYDALNYVEIGRRNTGGATFDQYFDGRLDDVRLYDRALSNREIFYLAKTTIPPKPQDMIAEWKFENNLNDNIGSNNLTALQGSPSYQSQGWEGACNVFSNSVMGFSSTPAFELQTFSVSLRVQITSNFEINQRPIGNYYQDASDPLNRFGWHIQKDSSGGYSYQEYDGSSVSIRGPVILSDSSIRKAYDSIWQHICYVRTPTGSKLYIDAEVALETGAPTGSINYGGANQEFTIGGLRNISSYVAELDGLVDSVRYYNRELTQDEVRALALRDSFSETGGGDSGGGDSGGGDSGGGDTTLEDAPSDGGLYSRQNGAWVAVTPYSYFSVWAEENAALGASATDEWAFGNGADTPFSQGVPVGVDCELYAGGWVGNGGTASIGIYRNGTLVATVTGVNTTFTAVSFSAGDIVGFRTISSSGTGTPNTITAHFRVPLIAS